MNDDALRLDRQLCFPLYACSREIVKKYKPFLDAIGLTYTQYIVMLVLWEEQTVTAKALGERLRLDSGTLTPLLKRLEAQGLIARARSPKDERTLVVSLTDAGRALKLDAADIPARIGACITISPDDAMTLYRILYQILGDDRADDRLAQNRKKVFSQDVSSGEGGL